MAKRTPRVWLPAVPPPRPDQIEALRQLGSRVEAIDWAGLHPPPTWSVGAGDETPPPPPTSPPVRQVQPRPGRPVSGMARATRRRYETWQCLCDEGMSQEEVARQYGVTRSAVATGLLRLRAALDAEIAKKKRR